MAVIEKNSKRDEMKKVYCGECAWFKKKKRIGNIRIRFSSWWYCSNKEAYLTEYSTPLELVMGIVPISDFNIINADNDCKHFNAEPVKGG